MLREHRRKPGFIAALLQLSLRGTPQAIVIFNDEYATATHPDLPLTYGTLGDSTQGGAWAAARQRASDASILHRASPPSTENPL